MISMKWKTKQILMVLFGGLAIFSLFGTFLARNDILLGTLNLGIFGISIIIALIIKTIPTKRWKKN